ncbi:hypothetical protein RJD23_00445 [Buchnera aphidicola (Ceratoglyphina bambusae)]|uniref:primosomal protein N' family DNA-binding protein n=1 Tax=Buchnera aphidicola TaxID=9 RepID=UPI0031B8A909
MCNIMFVVKVMLFIPINKTFAYLYNFKKKPIVGGRVIINFKKNKSVGIILSYKIYNKNKKNIELKYVDSIIDNFSIFNYYVWNTILKCSKYYRCSINFIIFFGVPKFIKKGNSFKNKLNFVWSITKLGRLIDINILKKTPKQFYTLSLLRKKNIDKIFLKKCNISNYIFSQLCKKKLCEKVYKDFKISFINKNKINNNFFLKSNDVFCKYINRILSNLNNFSTWLITDNLFYMKLKFYFALFKNILKNDLKILFIVSNLYMLNKIKNEIKKNMSYPIYSYHSKLTDSKKIKCWNEFQKKNASIIISTKVGVFVPIKNLGIIILDEENNLSYRVLGKWTFNLKSVILLRSYYEKIPVILESSEPNLSTLYNVQKNKINCIKISNDILNFYKNLKKILIDIKIERFRGVFSLSLIKEINFHLKNNYNICLIIDGFSYMFYFVKCFKCNYIFRCNVCYQICEFKIHEGVFVCRFCFNINKEFKCLYCKCEKFVYSRCNTSFLIKNIKEIFDNTVIIFLDKNNTNKNIKFFSKSIFISKKKYLYKYNLYNIKLLIFLYIDYYFLFPNFRSTEYFSQIYYSIIRLFLESYNSSFKIIIQTNLIYNMLFKKLIYNGYNNFSKYLLKCRKKYKLPPFSLHAIFRIESNKKHKILFFLKYIKPFLEKISKKEKKFWFMCSNYIFLEKYKKFFYYNILFSNNTKFALRKIFDKILKYFNKFLSYNKIYLIFDIDSVQIISFY